MFASKDTLLTRPSGYNIARSVRTRNSASAYFNRTFTTPTNNKIWTMSLWVKRGLLAASQSRCGFYSTTGTVDYFEFSNDRIMLTLNNTTGGRLETTAVYRDPSAWYHIVIAIDTTQATAANRWLLYVNGVQVTSFITASYPSQNYNTAINSAVAQYISAEYALSAGNFFDGYLTEINFIDGQALTPSSFGETDSITGVWKPKAYSGTYGTNGFELNFSDNSSNTATTIGKDYSGNGNNWTPNNISVTSGVTYDSMVDSPTVGATSSNYAVLNPTNLGGTSITLSNGNLFATFAGASWFTTSSTIGMNGSGKYYFEFTKTDTSNQMVGIFPSTASISTYAGNDANGYSYYSANGLLYFSGGGGATFGASYTNGDVIGVAFDASTGKLWFSKNNTWQASGDPSAGTSPAATASTAYTYVAAFSTNGSGVGTVNFGQRPFSYTPPTGFVALNTYNLPASTIKNGGLYMKPVLYTGDGTTNKSITGVGFQTDFNWTKSRSSASYSHQLSDSVRGFSKYLYSNATNAEGTDATNHIQSVNSDGYVINSGASFNASGVTYVAWNWKAGTTSSSNTNGSITSTVSVGATQGFSVVTYTGNATANATVGHGLGVAPNMVIVKVRSTTGGWWTYHVSIGKDAYLDLSSTAASASSANYWGSTGPTSTTFQINGGGGVNSSGSTYVAYCFSAVAGYSAFGSYTGNGSADGTFVYTGFRPRWLLIKRTTVESWIVVDSSRDPYNVVANYMLIDTSNAEANGVSYDFVSNGIKFRGTSQNQSGATYIYACFAESPFKTSLAR